MDQPAEEVIRLRVVGTPAPKGSTKFVGMRRSKKTGKLIANLQQDAKGYDTWSKQIEETTSAALLSLPHGERRRFPLDGPLAVTLTFLLPRPARPRRPVPAVKPDLDKLQRAVFDGLTKGRMWVDDSRVVDSVLRKRYVVDGQSPGVEITVSTLF